MIEINKLNLYFKKLRLLEDISFSLKDNEALAIMGQSGSGKSLLARSFIKLFDENFSLSAKDFVIDGKDVLKLNEKGLRAHRKELYLIFQNSYLSFHPLINLGAMFNIVLKDKFKDNIKERAFKALEAVGLNDFELIWHSFVHQLSEGTLQRVQIAMALASEAKYLICDEITTNIDAEHKKVLLKLLAKLKSELCLILITHEENFANSLCDKLLIVNQNKIKSFTDIKC